MQLIPGYSVRYIYYFNSFKVILERILDIMITFNITIVSLETLPDLITDFNSTTVMNLGFQGSV
jgi:hypothetical protein